MSRKTLNLNPALYEYLLNYSLREPPLLKRLREETANLRQGGMQIAPEQGQFMTLLVHLMNVKKAIEVGVFTGYSSLVVALALPADGRLIACDINETWTQTARKYWQEAGVEAKIDLCLAPAMETLDKLIAEGQVETFDFAFIDADKGNYVPYYERLLRLLRPGGLIAIDNVLWGGSVADSGIHDEDTDAIRAFNEHLHKDERITFSMLPIGDGLSLALKQ